jgi:mono/diheme cytochrome c family protein
MPTLLSASLRRLASAAALALAAALATAPRSEAQARDQYHTAPLDTVEQATYDGWKQYELNCARCHGEYAMGTSFAPNLSVSVKEGGTIPTKAAFMQVVCAGRPDKGMPAWCPLGMEMSTIDKIYAYVKGRADGKIRPGRPAVKGS